MCNFFKQNGIVCSKFMIYHFICSKQRSNYFEVLNRPYLMAYIYRYISLYIFFIDFDILYVFI